MAGEGTEEGGWVDWRSWENGPEGEETWRDVKSDKGMPDEGVKVKG